jgi:RHS repeat-associated protein
LPYAPGWTIDEALETRNNRLLEYREYASLNPDPGALLRTVRYEYIEQTGHAAHLTTKDNYIDPYTTPGDPADYDIYRDLWLVYAKSGTLWKAVWQEWDAAGVPQNQWHRGWPYPTTPDRYTACWEFRYDTSGRERYYVRDWDVRLGTPDNLNPVLWTAGVTLWTDYLDEQPYVDYTVAEDHPNEMIEPERGFPSLVPTERERYLAGLGVHGQQTITPAGPTTWLHGDLIRSTMLTTDEGGTAVSAVAYSAFGEEVSTAGAEPGRYRFAGGWGYESGLLTLGGANPDLAPITLQHVGWRWYQPSVGRFVQRDPAGLSGAENMYLYCRANVLSLTDPPGLGPVDVTDEEARQGVRDFVGLAVDVVTRGVEGIAKGLYGFCVAWARVQNVARHTFCPPETCPQKGGKRVPKYCPDCGQPDCPGHWRAR